MQRAVVTKQKMRNLNVRQGNAMFNLAAVQSAVPLRECKLSALAATVQWLYQWRFASAQPRHRWGTASDHRCPESLSDRRVLVSALRSYSQLDWGQMNSLARHLVQWSLGFHVVAVRWCPVHGVQVRCPAGIWRRPLTYAEYPVSYTHLTLPTIYSV